MKKTLQDQYLLIKEGKGHKDIFLKEAKSQFPNIVRNAATFEEAAASLKTKNIISENVVGINAINSPFESRKKESFESAFESFLAEAKKKKENEDEKVKAEEKKVSKPVEKDLSKIYDKTDDKNPDNLIFDQIMKGYYAEMKDPKNADKTMQQLKDIVLKNLSKDPIYYTKDGQFGVKGLGYETEVPGLGTPKEAKGKYKSSGYGNLNESQVNEITEKDIQNMDELDLKSKLNSMGVTPIVVNSILSTKGVEGLRNALKDKLKDRAIGFKESIGRNYPGELEGEYEGELQKIYGADIYDTLKDILDISNSEDDFINKITMSLTDETNVLPKNSEEKLRIWYKKNTPNLEEEKIRKVIREIISEELEGLTQENAGPASYRNPKAQGGGGGRRYIPTEAFLSQEMIDKLDFSNPGPNTPTRNESLQIPHIKFLTKPDGSLMLISDFLYNAMQGIERGRTSREKEMGKNELEKLISEMDPMVRAMIKKNVDPKMTFGIYHAVNMPIEREKGVGVKIPLSKEELEELMLNEENSNWEQKWETSAKDKETVMYFKRNMNPEEWNDFLSKHREDIKIALMEIQSLKESVEKELAEINKEAESEVLEAKLQKITDAIDRRQSQLNRLDEDEDMKALTDKKKVKELQKEIKTLEKAKSKLEKLSSKKSKGAKKEVIDEDEPIDEAEGDPTDVKDMSADLDKVKKTMTDMSKIEIFEEEPEEEY